MKLLNLVPVTARNLVTPDDLAYLRRFIRPDIQVDLDQITLGSPCIEDEFSEALCLPDIIRHVIAAQKAGYDGVAISCFGDPAVKAARECVDIPVVGGFEPTMSIALGLGDRIGILAIMPETEGQVRRNIGTSRLDGRVCCVKSLGVGVLDLHDHEKAIEATYKTAKEAILKDGADVIVLGCTGMVGVAGAVQEMLAQDGCQVPVLEPGVCALSYLAMITAMGLKVSRTTYHKVSAEKIGWALGECGA